MFLHTRGDGSPVRGRGYHRWEENREGKAPAEAPGALVENTSIPQNLVEKIVQADSVGLEAGVEVRSGDSVTVRPRHVMTHDNRAAVMQDSNGLGADKMAAPLRIASAAPASAGTAPPPRGR